MQPNYRHLLPTRLLPPLLEAYPVKRREILVHHVCLLELLYGGGQCTDRLAPQSAHTILPVPRARATEHDLGSDPREFRCIVVTTSRFRGGDAEPDAPQYMRCKHLRSSGVTGCGEERAHCSEDKPTTDIN